MASIAAELGYASPSAFAAMVRRSVGATPSRSCARARCARAEPTARAASSRRHRNAGVRSQAVASVADSQTRAGDDAAVVIAGVLDAAVTPPSSRRRRRSAARARPRLRPRRRRRRLGRRRDAASRGRRVHGDRARRAVLGRAAPAAAREGVEIVARRQPAAADRDPASAAGARAHVDDRACRATRGSSRARRSSSRVDFVRLDAIALGGSGTITGHGLQPRQLAAVDRRLGRDPPAGTRGATSSTSRSAAAAASSPTATPARSRSSVAGSGRCDARAPRRRRRHGQRRRQRHSARPCRDALARPIAGSGDVLYRGDATPQRDDRRKRPVEAPLAAPPAIGHALPHVDVTKRYRRAA